MKKQREREREQEPKEGKNKGRWGEGGKKEGKKGR